MGAPQVLRIAKISKINYQSGTAQVTYEDRSGAATNELPFIAWTYRMPQIGDRVLVGYLSNGTTSAVIIGPVWCAGHRPAAYGAARYRQELSHTAGNAYIDYDGDTGLLHIRAEKIELDASDGSSDTTLTDLLSRISELETKVGELETADLGTRVGQLESDYSDLDRRVSELED